MCVRKVSKLHHTLFHVAHTYTNRPAITLICCNMLRSDVSGTSVFAVSPLVTVNFIGSSGMTVHYGLCFFRQAANDGKNYGRL